VRTVVKTNFCLGIARPHPGLLPLGEGTTTLDFGFSMTVGPNSVAGVQNSRRMWRPLLEERVGVRTVVKTILRPRIHRSHPGLQRAAIVRAIARAQIAANKVGRRSRPGQD